MHIPFSFQNGFEDGFSNFLLFPMKTFVSFHIYMVSVQYGLEDEYLNNVSV